MSLYQQHRNRLLSELRHDDYGFIAPYLREVPLARGLLLQEQEAPVEKVYFPITGVISLVSVMERGEVVETAMVGREGAVGLFGGLGPWNAFTRATVQLPGIAAVMPVASFQAAVAQSDRIRNLILRYKEALLGQVQQTAACNALHELEERLARWLLQALDRSDSPNLPLTQDFISQMLAVRRSTVTVIAGKLQQAGLIRYHRVCELKGRCTRAPFRKIARDINEEARDHVCALMDTPEFEQSSDERKKVEMRFAQPQPEDCEELGPHHPCTELNTAYVFDLRLLTAGAAGTSKWR